MGIDKNIVREKGIEGAIACGLRQRKSRPILKGSHKFGDRLLAAATAIAVIL